MDRNPDAQDDDDGECRRKYLLMGTQYYENIYVSLEDDPIFLVQESPSTVYPDLFP